MTASGLMPQTVNMNENEGESELLVVSPAKQDDTDEYHSCGSCGRYGSCHRPTTHKRCEMFANDHTGGNAVNIMSEVIEYGNSDHIETFDFSKYNKTDAGNAELFIDFYNGELLYCDEWGKWLLWDGVSWMVDTTQEINRRALVMVKFMIKDAKRRDAYPGNDDVVGAHTKYAMLCESHGKLKNMVTLAQSIVPVTHDELDCNKYLLNVVNGTIDLKTGTMMPHYEGDLITKTATVVYNENAKCPKWLDFLNIVFDGNQDVIKFMQRALGYVLTGDTKEQVIFILYGDGNNGKSVLLDTISKIMNDYAKKVMAESIMQKTHSDDKRNDLAALEGTRFVTAGEGSMGRRMESTVVKDISSGEKIRCRFLNHEFFEYYPQFKLWMATNHKPIIAETDKGIWRRIILIEFKVDVPAKLKELDRERIGDYQNVLFNEEAAGILNWMIQGCLEWQGQGLNPPVDVIMSINDYRRDMDSVQQFIDEHCIVDKNAEVAFTVMYTAYESWCENSGESAVGRKRFATVLTEKGFDKKIGHGNAKYRKGIAVKPL